MRRTSAPLAVVAVLVGTVTLLSAPADAALSFQLAPTSGPPGTVVSVSGSCTGFLVDNVALNVATLPQPVLIPAIPVSGGGVWQTQFTVPAGSVAGGALVTATCGTNLPFSATFTVTAPPSTTTTPTMSPPSNPSNPADPDNPDDPERRPRNGVGRNDARR